jgi:hypothetical protein
MKFQKLKPIERYWSRYILFYVDLKFDPLVDKDV